MKPEELILLTGCTAVGKTELSVFLAKHLGSDILSCDSVQVYRGADIGSAKITETEKDGVRHYGIDICEPTENFDVSQFINYTENIVKDTVSKGKSLVVVGGTGLYLKSFFSPVIDRFVVPESVRREVLAIQNQGIEALQQRLKEQGPVDLNHSDWNNPRRLTKFLEKSIYFGLSQKDIKGNYECQEPPFPNIKKKLVELYREDEILLQRVKIRIDQMIATGLIEEVRHLGSMCSSLKNAIGYREVLKFLAGEISSENQLKNEIFLGTKKLIKKQKTWMKTQLPEHLKINLDQHSLNESFDLIYSLS